MKSRSKSSPIFRDPDAHSIESWTESGDVLTLSEVILDKVSFSSLKGGRKSGFRCALGLSVFDEVGELLIAGRLLSMPFCEPSGMARLCKS